MSLFDQYETLRKEYEEKEKELVFSIIRNELSLSKTAQDILIRHRNGEEWSQIVQELNLSSHRTIQRTIDVFNRKWDEWYARHAETARVIEKAREKQKKKHIKNE